MTERHHDHASSDASDDFEEREIRYPENRVLGLLDSPEQLGSTVNALTSGGFLRSEVEVICGRAAAEKLRENTGRTGLASLAMRIGESIGMPNDETAIKNKYADALKQGRILVTVLAPSDDRKAAATRIFQTNGADEVRFFGKRFIEGPARAD
jgi:hypothetical protein